MAKAQESGTALEVEMVKMEQVPDPPIRSSWGKWNDLYRRIRALGLGEHNAVKVVFAGQTQFTMARHRLRKLAEAEGLRLLSSRAEDYTRGYFWLAKPE